MRKKTILAPTAVYRGLKRSSDAPATLRDGWAICGKPSRAYDNEGRAEPAPPGMLYMVFADKDGFVFDWDWVAEDPDTLGHPLNMELRFGDLVQESRELVLDLPEYQVSGQFDATKPIWSRTGDCVFCYMKDEPSFAERINEDLTVFYSLHERSEVTGFKIKNVQHILAEEQELNLSDAPGLMVLILPILRRTQVDHQDLTTKLYELIIRVLVNVKMTSSVSTPSGRNLEVAMC